MAESANKLLKGNQCEVERIARRDDAVGELARAYLEYIDDD